MKFLIVGLGSAGQRHVRNLRQLCPLECELYAWRVRGLDVVIDNQLQAVYGHKPEEAYGLKTVHDLETALSMKPDAVIVANPIALHLETAMAAVKARCHVFIEKPVSNRWDGVEKLIRLAREKQVVISVGYQMRFHPGLQRIKQHLDSGKIGNVISAYFHVGEFLPGLHPYEDYRQGNAARRDQGGGVILAFSHELDTVQWLFGMPTRVYATGGRLSDLQIDVEDMAAITLEHHKAGRKCLVQVHLDFLQQPPRRFCEIVGDAGTIRWDYRKRSVSSYDPESGKWTIETFDGFDRNQLFMDAMENFLLSIAGKATPCVSLEEGAQTLRVALAAHDSMNAQKPVQLSS